MTEAHAVQTVTGSVRPEALGRTLIHEHVLVGFPGWQLDALAPRFFLAELAQKSGMQIVCTTGAYFEAEGITHTFRYLPIEDITAIYIKEITEGVGNTGIRAGAVKIATGAHRVSEYEEKLVRAGARAARETGVPLISHTQEASCGHEQIDLVTGEGVPAHRLVVGHSDGIDDESYHRSLAERGAFVGFDRFGITLIVPDEVRVKNVLSLAAAGHTRNILLSHDSISCWQGRPVPFANRHEDVLATLPDWRPTSILTKIVPQLREAGLSDGEIATILVDNPRRLFAAA
jgi:phosphotriesterase-related protein